MASAATVSIWPSAAEFLVRHRVRISVAVFSVLVVEDLVMGFRPHNVVDLHDPRTAVGWLLVLTGLLLRSWSAGVLRKGNGLATTGPYALCRNPLYLGSLFVMLGYCSLLNDVENLWVTLGPVAGLYYLTIRREEKRLAARYAETWPQYAAAVPRLVPYRLPKSLAHEWSIRQWLTNGEYKALLAGLAGLAGLAIWRNYL